MTKIDIVRRNLAHLGIILCHLSIVGFILMLSGFLGTFLSIVIFLFGLLIIIVTLGIVFAFIPDYWSKLMNVFEGSSKMIELFFDNLPLIGTVSIVCCIASIVLTSLDLKWDKAKPRLIVSSIILGLLVLFIVALLMGVIRGEAS